MRGTTFAGKFLVKELIGSGGMGRVYRAVQIGLDRSVALKVLNDALAGDELVVERLLREARTCASLDHTNIVAVYDMGKWKNKAYIAMEYVDSLSLQKRLEKGISKADALRILVQVARALDCAHKSGVIHRDLKPENILVTKEGKAKVADWGISYIASSSTKITATGVVLGSPPYMSPEQIMDEKLGPQSDLYSLGVIIFEVLAGRLPFEDEQTGEMLVAHLKKQPPSLLDIAPAVSPELAALVAALLEKEPRFRPSCAEDVARELEEQLPGLEGECEYHDARSAASRAVTKKFAQHGRPGCSDDGFQLLKRALIRACFVALVAVFFCAYGTHVSRWFGYDNSSGVSAKLEGRDKTPVTMKEAGFVSPEEIEILYRGGDGKDFKVSIMDSAGVTVTRGIDVKKSRAVSRSVRSARIKLDKLTTSPLRISCGAVTRVVDPVSYIMKRLPVLNYLNKSMLDSISRGLVAVRRDYVDPGRDEDIIRRRVFGLLSANGIDRETISGLNNLVRFYRGRGLTCNSRIARALFPFMALEAFLDAFKVDVIPWLPLATAFGLKVAFQRHRFKWAFDAGNCVTTLNLVRTASVDEPEEILWLFPSECIDVVRNNPECWKKLRVDWCSVMNEKIHETFDWSNSCTRVLKIPRVPGRPVLYIAVAYFWRGRMIELTLNGGRPYRVCCCARNKEGLFTSNPFDKYTVSLLLDPKDLKKGENTVALKIVHLAGRLRQVGTCFYRIALFERADN